MDKLHEARLEDILKELQFLNRSIVAMDTTLQLIHKEQVQEYSYTRFRRHCAEVAPAMRMLVED